MQSTLLTPVHFLREIVAVISFAGELTGMSQSGQQTKQLLDYS